MKSSSLSREVEAVSRVDDWVYDHRINDDHKAISDDIDVLQRLAFQATIGRWLGKPIHGYSTVRCSNCNETFAENRGKWRFCPMCGCKMEN